MKIAFVVSYFPNLSETFVLNQITGLIDQGYEVDIYAGRPGNATKLHADVERYNLLEHTYYTPLIPNNHILRVFKGIWLFLSNWKQIPLLLKTLNLFKHGKQAASLLLFYSVFPFLPSKHYDIIHCHFGQNGLMAIRLRELRVLQGKVITTFHGNDITTYLEKEGLQVYSSLFTSGDLFLPISERWKKRLIELGCKKEILVHRMGIDCDKFTFIPRLLRSDGQIRLVTVARLVEKKGVEYSIRAVANLIQNEKTTLKYSIIGDGTLRDELQQLIETLGVSHVINMMGWKQQEEVISILNNSDILLAPSVTSRDGDQEGIPVVLMEAMAMGLPIISTYHSGIPELIENGVTGFLVPERDVEALSERLSYLINHPEMWLSLGEAGRAFVEEHYNINRLNNHLVAIYQKLLVSGYQK